MKNFICNFLILAIALQTPFAVPAFALSEQDRAEMLSRNKLSNGGFEQFTQGWTISGGTLTTATSTANRGSGKSSGSWSSSAAAQTLISQAVTVVSGDGLSGNNGVVSCRFKAASGTATHTLTAIDGSGNNLAPPTTLSSSTSAYIRTSVNFTFPASGSAKLKITSVSASEPTLYSDDCYLGLAEGFNLAQVSVSTAPTIQKFTSGSGTYTLPTSPKPLYIRVRMVGGGGGGAGSGTAAGTGQTAGGTTTFGSSFLTANGGGIGNWSGAGNGGAGGSASIGAGATGIAVSGGGGTGQIGLTATFTTATFSGGAGGNSAFGGSGAASGGAAAANTGAGGAGGGTNGATAAMFGGGGGGAGGYVDAIVSSPSATYAYAVGAGGALGTAGASGTAGGAGGSGVIIVEEYYQSQAVSVYRPDNGGLSAGEVVTVASASCPVGTIAADGAPYLRATYPDLFASVGTRHGDGTKLADGATTSGFSAGTAFNVPNYRGRFLRGWANGSANDLDRATRTAMNTGGLTGDNVGSVQADATSKNGLALTDPGHYHRIAWAGTNLFGVSGSGNVAAGGGTGTFNIEKSEVSTTGITLGAGDNETRPLNASVNYCIRTVAASAAPIQQGQISSNTSGQERIEHVAIGGASDNTNCITGTCNKYRESGSWVGSPTWVTGGHATITYNVGAFSSTPVCWCNTKRVGTSFADACNAYVSSGTTITVDSNGGADAFFTLTCMGPR